MHKGIFVVIIFCIILGLSLQGAIAQTEAEADRRRVNVPLVLDLTDSIAGAQFSFSFTDGLSFLEYKPSEAVKSGSLTPVARRNDTVILGFYSGANNFAPRGGLLDMGHLVFENADGGKQTVTISQIKLVTVVDRATSSTLLGPITMMVSEDGSVDVVDGGMLRGSADVTDSEVPRGSTNAATSPNAAGGANADGSIGTVNAGGALGNLDSVGEGVALGSIGGEGGEVNEGMGGTVGTNATDVSAGFVEGASNASGVATEGENTAVTAGAVAMGNTGNSGSGNGNGQDFSVAAAETDVAMVDDVAVAGSAGAAPIGAGSGSGVFWWVAAAALLVSAAALAYSSVIKKKKLATDSISLTDSGKATGVVVWSASEAIQGPDDKIPITAVPELKTKLAPELASEKETGEASEKKPEEKPEGKSKEESEEKPEEKPLEKPKEKSEEEHEEKSKEGSKEKFEEKPEEKTEGKLEGKPEENPEKQSEGKLPSDANKGNKD